MGLFSRNAKRPGCTAQSNSHGVANSDVEVNQPHQTNEDATAAMAMAMALSAAAPTFKERKACGHCATKFAMPMRRRHHCRNCGESCCHKCMSATKRPIPWYQAAETQKNKEKQEKKKEKLQQKGKAEKQKKPKNHKVCTKCDLEVFSADAVRCDEAPVAAEPQPIVPVAQSTVVPAPPMPQMPDTPNPADDDEQPWRLLSQEDKKARKLRKKEAKKARKLAKKEARKKAKKERKDKAKSNNSARKSIWNLPIRPLLKRKESVEQLRNRQWDLALQKAAANGGDSSARNLAVVQPCA